MTANSNFYAVQDTNKTGRAGNIKKSILICDVDRTTAYFLAVKPGQNALVGGRIKEEPSRLV
ncbi:MAG: hypothetical protein ACR2L1_03845 [Pyrinomonadaceae bacterium]